MITSLEGCPNWVGQDFTCNNNELTNLEFAPHSSAPRTISSNPPGDEIKNASTFPSFLILWRNK